MNPLKFVPYIAKQAWRHRVRSGLTLMGIAIAMFLFTAVQAMRHGVEVATTSTYSRRASSPNAGQRKKIRDRIDQEMKRLADEEKAELEHLAFEFSTNWEAMRDHPGPKKKAKARRRRRRRQPAEEPADQEGCDRLRQAGTVQTQGRPPQALECSRSPLCPAKML